ncbi:hypothetical protein [Nocardia pseudobrasiliensis]|uniref:hypothetical protein n=1 Tax=Nocardia pseudobrasiliensis TaxID=45979 RepID=UPI000A89AEE7|nr:hypothetical protein [Nocardia pseudobrasiliensis]
MADVATKAVAVHWNGCVVAPSAAIPSQAAIHIASETRIAGRVDRLGCHIQQGTAG